MEQSQKAFTCEIASTYYSVISPFTLLATL